MPTMFAVNENSDLFIGPDGNLAIITGLEAVQQLVEHRTKTQLGEMIFATNQGIPNEEITWNGAPNLQQLEIAIRTTITNTPDVITINEFNIQQINDTVVYNVIFETTFGQAAINGQL